MFNRSSDENAISMLKEDHAEVKDLFDKFEGTDDPAEKEKILDQAVMALKIHATIEEEIFYPTVRAQLDDEDTMNEADEEHHVARLLIAELDNGGDGDHRNAKFTVLAESVRHHIKEEEGQMFPKAKKTEIDFEELGQRLLARKNELLENGVPSDAEHAMVENANGQGDSPAAKSRLGESPRAAA